MIPLKLKRRHLRAPINSDCLYKLDKDIFKARSLNISEGGVFLSEVKEDVPNKQLTVFLSLPKIPNFTTLSTNELLLTGKDSMESSIIGTIVEVRRETFCEEGLSKNLGCEFVDIRREAQEFIKDYVRTFGVDIVYTLTLFEQGTHKEEVSNLIRKCIELLGYDRSMSMAKIRESLLHDYQSLESL